MIPTIAPAPHQEPLAGNGQEPGTEGRIRELKCEIYDLSKDVQIYQQKAQSLIQLIQQREQEIAQLAASQNGHPQQA